MNYTLTLSKPLLLSGVLAFSFSFGATPVMANLFGKSELSGPWKERFQDVNKLNEYTQKGLKTEISDSLIKGFKLTGATINNATFRDVDWESTSLKNMNLSNARFIGNKFTKVHFSESRFTNVIFEDSEFNGISFYEAQMTGVKFIHCKFTAFSKTNFTYLKNSDIEFDFTTFEAEETGPSKISFSDSTANLVFRNSTLNGVELTDLILPSSLTFENSKLQDIDMSRSKLAKLVMDGVTGGGRSGFGGGSVAEVVVRNSEMGFSLNGGTLGKVSFANSKLEGGFTNSNIKELQINNCKGMAGLGLYQAKIEVLQISNCPINNIQPLEAIIQYFRIDKSSIVNSDFGDMKATNFTLTDVTLDQKIDFTGAHVEHLITKNVTKLPGLNLNLTNTNVKF